MKKNHFYVMMVVFSSLVFCSNVWPENSHKKLSFGQAFLNAEPRILKPITRVRYWVDDEHFLLLKRDEKRKTQKLFRVSAESGHKTIFIDYDSIQKKLPEGLSATQHVVVAKDFSGFIYEFKNDLYYYFIGKEKLKRLTATPSPESNPRFSPDRKFIAFTRDNNLYALNIKNGLEYQLTMDGSETIYNGFASWVYYEEILERSFRAFWWSPDSQKIAFLRFNDTPVSTFYLFSSRGVHGALEIERFPKAGDPNPKVKLGVVNIKDQKITWADIGDNADCYLAWPFWSPGSSTFTFQWMNRDQDNIKIFALNTLTGKIMEIYDEKQHSWVEFFKDIYLFKDGSGFLLRSNVDGWSHLYYYDLNGNLKKRLTQGEWSVIRIALVDDKKERVFFQARKDKTTYTHLFVVRLDGNGFKQLTNEPGTHRILVSPEGSYFIDNFSNIHTPSRQDLYRSDGTFIRNINNSRTPLMEQYPLSHKELFTIPTEDGIELPACWILPPYFDETKKYPVLFIIYGGPGSSTVTNSYPPLSSLYMAQEGIIILSVDHRSSGHFGKKGTSLMHRCLGKWEMHDLIHSVKWLRHKPFVDKEKIGITGVSYGGYITCMALTYGADYFSHGYARSSVTDWKLYDTVYTERYMDKPSENEEGYLFSSVLSHAHKLKGALFITHGDMDDNVHMQHTSQLVDKLIDFGKRFELMIYPNQRHGFRGKKREHDSRSFVDFWSKHFLNRKPSAIDRKG